MQGSICIMCGGILNKNMKEGVFVDSSVGQDSFFMLEGCLCFYTAEVLERIIERCREDLVNILKDVFDREFKSLSEIQGILKTLDHHSPLRVKLSRGLSQLVKGGERLKILKKQSQKLKQQQEELSETAQKKYSIGKPLSLKEWLQSK